MRASSVVVVAAVAAALGACSKGTVPERVGARWVVDSQPILSIGGDDGDTLSLLGDIEGAARLPDGEVVVADRSTSTLSYFSADGKWLRSVGRQGGGPGEFDHMWGMLRCGDSLFVNGGARKYSVFSLGGAFARQFSVVGPDSSLGAYRSACNSRGVLVSYGWDSLRDLPLRSSVTRATVPYWLSRADGTLLANLGRHAGSERWATIGKSVSGTGPLPLGKQPVIAVGRTLVYIGTADSFAIDVFALDGKRQGVIHRSVRPVKSTPADIERYKRLDTIGRNREDIAREVRMWSEVQYPATLPAYTALIVDSADNLWVRTFAAAMDRHATWIVFSPAGIELAYLELPHSLQVNEIGPDYILGTDTNVDTGGERVELLRLRRVALQRQ